VTTPPWISLFLEVRDGVSRKELRGHAQEISGTSRSDGTGTLFDRNSHPFEIARRMTAASSLKGIGIGRIV